jgi:hypothetical protein
MVCSICFESGHNKRNCPFQLKAPIGVDLSTVPLIRECDIPSNSEIKVAKELSSLLDKKMRKCSLCGECGHNIRTCPIKCEPCSDETTPSEKIVTKALPHLLGKKQRKCSLCGECGHNIRTCPIKCEPCSDQVARSFCFAGLSDSMAIKMARVLDCSSIYGETEEYL